MKEIVIQSLIDQYKSAEAETFYTQSPRCSAERKEEAEAARAAKLEAMGETRAYAALDKAIKDAQGRCTSRTIDVTDVLIWADRIQHRLSIPKSHMDYIRATVDIHHADTYSKRYTTPQSTHFQLEYRTGKWRVIRVWRDYIGKAHPVYLYLPPEARKAIADKYETMD
jgi:hypothetical protein